ncbi:MAG: hypothetical protein F2817_00120 [Actinobacteria bacterium]|nr:hypothetical protein [Actinomycetota bacterium]
MTTHPQPAPADRTAPPLPDPVARFFAAVAAEAPDAVAAAFGSTGVVRDEGESLDLAGAPAISGWVRDHLLAASVRLEPRGVVAGDGGATTVEVEVSGDFPGSPGRSVMRFVLDGPLVGELRIEALR